MISRVHNGERKRVAKTVSKVELGSGGGVSPAQRGGEAGSSLEQFKEFCSRRYVAARAVASGFKLGRYVFIPALRSKPNRTNPRRCQINGHIIF